jgi:predicted CXXCH cytochrome family protein
MIGRRTLFLLSGGLALLGVVAAVMLWPSQSLPALAFVGTKACASCHTEAFENWQQSHHFHAMEEPDADSVLGDFNDASFEHFGTTSRFFTRDGQYFVETDNASGELQTFPVAYTFGWYPLQQYLIGFPDGRLQALSISWDSRPAAQGGQRWYHLYPDEEISHQDPLHWTGSFQNWNSRCAACHSTELVKGYSQQDDRYQTRWKELNVGCEACHGPGSRHLAWANGQRSLDNSGLATRVGALWQPVVGARPAAAQAAQTRTTLSGQLNACGGCHSRRGELGQPDITADFFDNFTLSPLVEGLYFADGQMHEEVYEVGSFLQSRMHQNHVSCTNCHEPHSSRLRVTGNGLCLQCHEAPKFQSRDHFFHTPDSAGAQCVNCHMPERTYMGVDSRRDHSFRIPDPIASLRFGVPNACTQCHTDRDDAWAAVHTAAANHESVFA